MKNLLRKLRSNKGDAEPIFFVFGMMLVIFLLWFSLDLINMTWSRYTIKREAQTMSRLYALSWVDSVWDPECNDAQVSKCEYGNLQDSALAEKFDAIVTSAFANGKFSNFTVLISNNPDTTLEQCETGILCVRNDGGGTTISGWGPTMIKNNVDYGTDLYMTVQATVPFRYIGENLGLEDTVYTVYNKFASERFSKNDTGV